MPWRLGGQQQQTMRGDDSTWRQAVRPMGVAVDGRGQLAVTTVTAWAGGGNKDNVNLQNKRRTSPSFTLSGLPSFYVVLHFIW